MAAKKNDKNDIAKKRTRRTLLLIAGLQDLFAERIWLLEKCAKAMKIHGFDAKEGKAKAKAKAKKNPAT